jgi:hypothetical protein
LLSLKLRYAEAAALELAVPDMGLTEREWAQAAFVATGAPFSNRYGVPGALEVAVALESAGALAGPVRPVGDGDRVEVGGKVLRCIAVDEHRVDAWGLGVPTFTEPQPVPVPRGPVMRVSGACPPPEAVAYCEDARDRLWTGKGGGEWRCLTDPAGRTAPLLWAGVWREHGPLTPLVQAVITP